MSQSSERIVVFVTPAQKRVLAARAQRMGISVSELVRRAVLAFDDTGEEVRAAGLVDRLGAAARHHAIDDDLLRRLAAGPHVQDGSSGQTDGNAKQPAPDVRVLALAPSPNSTLPPSEPESDETPAALPVAAAVARALALEAGAPAQPGPDHADEAAVARAIANQSRDLSRF
ncbi:hypothetical protein [Trinickia sp. Y13]|uniref:hypothetical protein n=1 Tax=Trinickia sp. Y13 TaxID=2917807 RepID=UPI002406274A|nr:hypothetical protein [Trinickia sp. Y13]MDG0024177.1 hypothetical protein [Trinickia sp. Y13]